jgi:hypothetical protein
LSSEIVLIATGNDYLWPATVTTDLIVPLTPALSHKGLIFTLIFLEHKGYE